MARIHPLPDNIYEVMVEATDGTGHVGRKAVKVEVTNVDEDGTVKLSALQPAPGVAFTATLTDIDNGTTDLTSSAEWQWSRSTRTSGGWTDIDKATSSSYTPDVDGADSGYYLRATAKYKDKQSPSGADNDKTASMVSANKVLALRLSNKTPKFADAVDDEGTYVRTVAETAAAGQLVGDPVTAEDEDANDVLTYTLALEDGSGNFVIDRATGQISVAKGAEFNHNGDDTIPADNCYRIQRQRHCHRPYGRTNRCGNHNSRRRRRRLWHRRGDYQRHPGGRTADIHRHSR